jgi:hypothetical protein
MSEKEAKKKSKFVTVHGIVDNAEVKQGLFPMPGANLSLLKGGSKTKSDYHWTLANIIFEDCYDFDTKRVSTVK